MRRFAVVLVGGLVLGACAKSGGGGTKVDAPSFEGTSLPTCASAMVSRWAFPKSQTGSLSISYPFVFVGG